LLADDFDDYRATHGRRMAAMLVNPLRLIAEDCGLPCCDVAANAIDLGSGAVSGAEDAPAALLCAADLLDIADADSPACGWAGDLAREIRRRAFGMLREEVTRG
jgi:hypothetical protein